MLIVDVKDASALLMLRNGGKRMAYAVVNALNDTIKHVQKVEVANVGHLFTLRKGEFVKRNAAVIKQAGKGSGFASVGSGRYEARVQVGQKKRLLLAGFEAGNDRKSEMIASGYTPKGKSSAVPIIGRPARPSKQSSVPDAFTIKGLNLIIAKSSGKSGRMVSDFSGSKYKSRRAKSVKGKSDVGFARKGKRIIGEHRTFILAKSKKAPHGGVFQRIGPAKDDIRMIYSFVPNQKLKSVLKFVDHAYKASIERFPVAMRQQIDSAFAFAASRVFK